MFECFIIFVNPNKQSSWQLTGEFPAQRASNAENVSIWWRHRDVKPWLTDTTKNQYTNGGNGLMPKCNLSVHAMAQEPQLGGNTSTHQYHTSDLEI